MAITSAADLVTILRRHELLQLVELDELAHKVKGKKVDARTLAQKLIQQGRLTAFQANLLFKGRGEELTLGSYVVLERLGEGGMGQVLKARHKRLGRVVAIKIIHKDRLSSPNAIRRFHREIQAAAKLSHPNIVLAYDADRIGNTHFFTMEYIPGTDLNKLVKEKGPLPVKEASEYIRQAAMGLQHACERGLVHRDIKPHNLLIADGDSQGTTTVKILDMGLARASRPDGDGDGEWSTMTKEGAVVGTLDYIAPEQAMDAHTADIRADLYSLGCTFYFLLTGRVPFPGGDALAKLMKHKLEEPTPVEKLRPGVPPELAAMVRKLMAKNPQDRFQKPTELAAALASGASVAAWGGQAAPIGQHQRPLVLRVLTAIPWLFWRVVRLPGRIGWIIKGATAAFLLMLCLMLIFRGGNNSPQPTPTRKHAGPPLHIVNSIGMKLRYISPGKFKMGSPPNERDRHENEGPQHEVEITRPFYLGVYEVTQEEYHKVTGGNPSAYKSSPGQDPRRYPVESVSWLDASNFCRKLSELVEEREAGRVYRLPTEAEWEYACRADTASVFHYGDSLSSTQANFNGHFPYGSASTGPYLEKPMTIGSYRPNSLGLYDMHGNVWEWCADWYDENFYSRSPKQDPESTDDSSSVRVLRGGGWDSRGRTCRSACRPMYTSGFRNSSHGFRVAAVQSGP